jgi:hypothetical protein
MQTEKWNGQFWDGAQKKCALPENKQWKSWLRYANRRLNLNEAELKELFGPSMWPTSASGPEQSAAKKAAAAKAVGEKAAAAKAQAPKAAAEIAAAAKAHAEKVAAEIAAAAKAQVGKTAAEIAAAAKAQAEKAQVEIAAAAKAQAEKVAAEKAAVAAKAKAIDDSFGKGGCAS